MEAIKENGKVSGLCDIKWMCHLLRYGDWKRSRSQEEKGQTINSCWCMLKYIQSLGKKFRDVDSSSSA